MDFKDDGILTIDKIKKKKIKGYKFQYKPLRRYLIVHPDLESPDNTVLSDFSTGYRLFKLQIKPDKATLEQIKDKLEKYINHFSIEGIQEEIKTLQEKEALASQRKNLK